MPWRSAHRLGCRVKHPRHSPPLEAETVIRLHADGKMGFQRQLREAPARSQGQGTPPPNLGYTRCYAWPSMHGYTVHSQSAALIGPSLQPRPRRLTPPFRWGRLTASPNKTFRITKSGWEALRGDGIFERAGHSRASRITSPPNRL